jgi:hypothetical protein
LSLAQFEKHASARDSATRNLLLAPASANAAPQSANKIVALITDFMGMLHVTIHFG